MNHRSVSRRAVLSLIAIILISSGTSGIAGGSELGHPSRLGPVISDVGTDSTTFNSTIISWSTDILADSEVEISDDPSMTGSTKFTLSEMVTSHSILVYGLSPSTRYYYTVTSTDASENSVTDDNDGYYHNFTAAASNDPTLKNMISMGPTTGDAFNITVTASDDWGVTEIWSIYSIDGSPEARADLKWAGMIWYTHIDIPSDALEMEFTIHCTDIEGNYVSIGSNVTPVIDNDAPVIQPFEYGQATSGDPLQITIKATDNIGVTSAYVRSWYDLGSLMVNSSMERIDNSTWSATINIPDDPSHNLRFKVAVGDASGNWADTETKTSTIDDNDPPIANAGGDIAIINGETAVLDASGCSDNDGIMNYTWIFTYGNETIYFHTVRANFTFDDPGIYNVTLKVMDNSSLVSVDNFNITVEDTVPPVPEITGNLSAPAGQTLVLSGEGSTDNDAIVEYRWTFYDGEEVSIDGPILSRVFLTRGFFEITLTVFDRWNLSASETIEVEIVDSVDPVPVGPGDIIAGIGKEVIFDGSASTDDGEIKVYYWNFDHEGEEVELFGEIVTYTFNQSGEYDVAFTVFDQTGNFATEIFIVTIVDKGVLRGNVTDEDGKPMAGIPVIVKGEDGKEYSTETGEDGSFELEVPQGKIEYSIGGSDHEKIKGEMEIEALQEVTLDLSDRPLKEKDDLNILMIIIAVLVILILIAGLSLLFYMRIKKADEESVAISSGVGPLDQTMVSAPYPIADPETPVQHREIEVKGEIPLYTRGPEDEEEQGPQDPSRIDDLFEE